MRLKLQVSLWVSISLLLSFIEQPSSKSDSPLLGHSMTSSGHTWLICCCILPRGMLAPQLFLHWISNFGQSSRICSSISFKGSMRPHSRRQFMILNGHSLSLCSSKFFLNIFPHYSLFGQGTGVYLHCERCLSMSPIFEIWLQSSFGQLIDSSWTSLLIGIFGLNCPTILWLQRGQVVVYLMQASQNKLWQHGVSTASS